MLDFKSKMGDRVWKYGGGIRDTWLCDLGIGGILVWPKGVLMGD